MKRIATFVGVLLVLAVAWWAALAAIGYAIHSTGEQKSQEPAECDFAFECWASPRVKVETKEFEFHLDDGTVVRRKLPLAAMVVQNADGAFWTSGPEEKVWLRATPGEGRWGLKWVAKEYTRKKPADCRIVDANEYCDRVYVPTEGLRDPDKPDNLPTLHLSLFREEEQRQEDDWDKVVIFDRWGRRQHGQ